MCGINLVLEMFADTVIYCLVQLAWGFPPRSKLMLRKVFQLAQPLFRQSFNVKINVATCLEQDVEDS